MDMAGTRYNAIARTLHWSMALLVLAMIPVGFLMIQEGLSRPLQNALFIFHKNVGVLLLILAVLRLAHRWLRPPPPLPDHVPGWQARAAGWSHTALYVLLIAMPVAGYVRVVAGGFPIEARDALGVPDLVPASKPVAEFAKSMHFYGAYAIAGLIGLHVLAALYHGLIRRDGVFSRIWPPLGARPR
jgi:cytochrome b561